jgi:uncharacterized protein (TIGR03067 family)
MLHASGDDMFKQLAIVAVALLAIGADEPRKTELNEAARKELKALEGDWVLQRIETKDGKDELADGESFILTIDGTKCTFGTIQEAVIVALDPSANPKLLDLKTVRKGREDSVGEAIYKVDKDMLVICIYQGKDKKRPNSLDKPTDGDALFTFKRSKK